MYFLNINGDDKRKTVGEPTKHPPAWKIVKTKIHLVAKVQITCLILFNLNKTDVPDVH